MSAWHRETFPSLTDHIRAIVRETVREELERAGIELPVEPRGPYGPPHNPVYAPPDDELTRAVVSLSF